MSEENLGKYVEENFWKVRKCLDYKLEYDECKSLNSRFYQYYINGQLLNCSEWKEDYENCKKYEDKEDLQAFRKIVVNEDERMKKRISAHMANDVWEKREKPNPHWNAELPEWNKKRQENSFKIIDKENDKVCIIF